MSNLNKYLTSLQETLGEHMNSAAVERLGLCKDTTFNVYLYSEDCEIPYEKLGVSKIFKTKDFINFLKSIYIKGKK